MKKLANKVKLIAILSFVSFMLLSVIIFFVREGDMGIVELIFVITLLAVALWVSFYFGQRAAMDKIEELTKVDLKKKGRSTGLARFYSLEDLSEKKAAVHISEHLISAELKMSAEDKEAFKAYTYEKDK